MAQHHCGVSEQPGAARAARRVCDSAIRCNFAPRTSNPLYPSPCFASHTRSTGSSPRSREAPLGSSNPSLPRAAPGSGRPSSPNPSFIHLLPLSLASSQLHTPAQLCPAPGPPGELSEPGGCTLATRLFPLQEGKAPVDPASNPGVPTIPGGHLHQPPEPKGPRAAALARPPPQPGPPPAAPGGVEGEVGWTRCLHSLPHGRQRGQQRPAQSCPFPSARCAPRSTPAPRHSASRAAPALPHLSSARPGRDHSRAATDSTPSTPTRPRPGAAAAPLCRKMEATHGAAPPRAQAPPRPRPRPPPSPGRPAPPSAPPPAQPLCPIVTRSRRDVLPPARPRSLHAPLCPP